MLYRLRAEMRPVHWAVTAVLTAALWLASGGGAAAAERIDRYTTPGCKGAPTWKIGYRLYSVNQGATLARGAGLEATVAAARRFAREVGTRSRCGVRIRIESWDEGEKVWDGCPTGEACSRVLPPDAVRFRRSKGYDAVFYRYPRISEDDFSGYANSYREGRRTFYHARFPVAPEDGADGNPWRNLLLHEWLHMVVWHYAGANWMPRMDPVHAGCEIEPYKSADPHRADGFCLVQGRYFRDLMRERVRYRGRRHGISKRTWRRCGTPSKPTRRYRRECYSPARSR